MIYLIRNFVPANARHAYRESAGASESKVNKIKY